jgi:acyl-CoA hydrolase
MNGNNEGGWAEDYGKKVRAADEAAQLVSSGAMVYVNGGPGFPCDVVEAITRRAPELDGVRIGLPMRRPSRELDPDFMAAEYAGHFFHVSDFSFDPVIRQAINEKRASYRPNIPTETARFYPDDVDVLVLTASPMDRHGYFSLGAFGGWGIDFVPRARRIVLEVNEHQPRIYGNCWLHISQVDAVVEADYPLIAASHSSSGYEVQVSDVERAIAGHIIDLIEDHSTLQFGGGILPQVVGDMLIDSGRRHLGIHSEALSDWAVDLVESGVVDNNSKTRHRGKTVFAVALGTPRLYDYIAENPGVEIHSIAYMNDPSLNQQNHKQVSINATLAVDLMGQCSSETLGTAHYSGTGGQWEFNRAGYLSGGKGIMALPSTARKGTVSRITPWLPEGSAVSITRNDVDYVVTEFGAVRLKGLDLPARARALISIAHPDFRDDLSKAAWVGGMR